MSYQVLARKWRPRTFREMVGQEHVLQALINALDHDRLHHAYLFTGTRGVGKTTIARILAKCLNCEAGVSSEPCGQCSSCVEIAEGRFVDLIEVDAASRTKVEDTRELLENVQYAPTRGRYKVYLIDEVHMLSAHSFNALLKTLEEPPPHVKFLLATTDPQKLPVTILSRCLQFNLKNMNPERIVEHLKFVLDKEIVPFDEAALWHLGRAADGSMRDALSLTDQAIAFGSGKVQEGEVRSMLGTIDQVFVYDIVKGLAASDGEAVLSAVARLAEHAPDYAGALAELLSILHRVAIAQALPAAIDNSFSDREQVLAFAQQIASEDLQLFYQTALLGRRDLPLAPDPRGGFEMTLLRMLAFKPQGVLDIPKLALKQAAEPPAQTPSATAPASSTPAAAVDEVAPKTDSDSQQQSSAVEGDFSKKPEAQAGAEEPPPWATEEQGQEQSQPDTASEMTEPQAETTASAQATSMLSELNPEAPSTPAQPEPTNSTQTAAAQAPEVQTTPIQPQTAEIQTEPAQPQTEVIQTELAQPQPAAAQTEQASPQAAVIQTEPLQSQAEPEIQAEETRRSEPKTEASEKRINDILNKPAIAPERAPTNQLASNQEPKIKANTPAKFEVQTIALADANTENWIHIYLGLGCGGVLQSTVSNCVLDNCAGTHFNFTLNEANSTLYDPSHQERLAGLLERYFDQPITVTINKDTVSVESPADILTRLKAERQTEALNSMNSDSVVQQMIQQLSAVLQEDTVEPID